MIVRLNEVPLPVHASTLPPFAVVIRTSYRVIGDPPSEGASHVSVPVPFAVDVHVSPAGASGTVATTATAMDKAFDAELTLASVTVTVKDAVPAVVGVPLMTPDGERARPAGGEPTDMAHEYGIVPPVAASVCEYATPTVPPGNDSEETARGAD